MKVIIIFFIFSFSIMSLAKSPNFTTNYHKLSAEIYNELAKTNNDNILVCPLSVEVVVALVLSGAKNETANEIRSTFHLPETTEEVEDTFKTLLPKLRSNEFFSLNSANKIYVQKTFPILKTFLDTTREVYQAESENIDFAKNVEAANTMNKWVEGKTQNKIKDLIDPGILSSDSVAVLINAIYFKAAWKNTFASYATKKSNFFKNGKELVEVDTMYNYDTQDTYKYYDSQDLNAQILELPFEGSEASVVIVLPKEKNGIRDLESKMDKVLAPQPLKDEFVDVVLPKFKIESTIDFKKILQKMGIERLFTYRADLTGIGGAPGELFVDAVIQKTFIDVNEDGVEAAAATFALVAESAFFVPEPKKQFIADHPFIFYLKVKDLALFVGKFTTPK